MSDDDYNDDPALLTQVAAERLEHAASYYSDYRNRWDNILDMMRATSRAVTAADYRLARDAFMHAAEAKLHAAWNDYMGSLK